MSFDVEDVAEKMFAAAAKLLQTYDQSSIDVARDEFTRIAELIAQIGVARQTNTITPEDAQDLLEAAKLDAKSAMDTRAGVRQIAAEDAINAALGAVSSIVNGYLGFSLI